MGTPLEGEHLHPYTLDPTPEDKYHGKEQIYTRAKDSDCTGIDQNRHKHGRNCAASTTSAHRRFITGNRDSWPESYKQLASFCPVDTAIVGVVEPENAT